MSQVVLSLDTSTPVLSSALVRITDGRATLLSHREAAPPVVTSTLVPAVFDEMLAEAGLRLDDVDVLATGIGPGLFTGVRVAVATMKAIAYARKKPLVGAQSLEAMALEAKSDGLVCPALDARKGEVYWAVYDHELNAVSPPQATTQADMTAQLAQLGTDVRIFGTGSPGQAEPRTPSAFQVAVLAMRRNPNPVFDPAAVLALEPFYLRPPEAEVARKKRDLGPR